MSGVPLPAGSNRQLTSTVPERLDFSGSGGYRRPLLSAPHPQHPGIAHFRRSKGCNDIPILVAALPAHQPRDRRTRVRESRGCMKHGPSPNLNSERDMLCVRRSGVRPRCRRSFRGSCDRRVAPSVAGDVGRHHATRAGAKPPRRIPFGPPAIAAKRSGVAGRGPAPGQELRSTALRALNRSRSLCVLRS